MLFGFLRRLLLRFTVLGALLALVLSALLHNPAPENFTQAKKLAREQIYHDQNSNQNPGTLYCGCNWQWTGASGGRIELESCGYKIRNQETRAKRIEWEHIVPASWLGNQRQCWKNGGRKNCSDNDPVFSRMEADLHNLAPVIGEVNADRSNYQFASIGGKARQYGKCTSQTDFKQRRFEPRDEVKGMVARVSFYMHDRYDLRMSKQQQQLLMSWHEKYPPNAWELERDRRTAKLMGHSNEFVTGKRNWSLNHQNSGDGLQHNLGDSLKGIAGQLDFIDLKQIQKQGSELFQSLLKQIN